MSFAEVRSPANGVRAFFLDLYASLEFPAIASFDGGFVGPSCRRITIDCGLKVGCQVETLNASRVLQIGSTSPMTTAAR